MKGCRNGKAEVQVSLDLGDTFASALREYQLLILIVAVLISWSTGTWVQISHRTSAM